MALGYFEGETHQTLISSSVLGGQLVANSDTTNYSQRPYFSLMFNAKAQQRKCDPSFLPQRCLSLHQVLSWAMWAFHPSDVPSKNLTTVTLNKKQTFQALLQDQLKVLSPKEKGKIKKSSTHECYSWVTHFQQQQKNKQTTNPTGTLKKLQYRSLHSMKNSLL